MYFWLLGSEILRVKIVAPPLDAQALSAFSSIREVACSREIGLRLSIVNGVTSGLGSLSHCEAITEPEKTTKRHKNPTKLSVLNFVT